VKLNFDLGGVAVVEFGVGQDDGGEQGFVTVPVDGAVQSVLNEMVRATWLAMTKNEDGPAKYEPSEKHGRTEYLYVPLGDDTAMFLRELHEAANLEVDSTALYEPARLSSYFARLTDKKGRRLTALRRAAQFKGVVKSRNRLVRMLDDTLKIIEDSVFKLDHDFDLIIDDANVHILRPSGFEFAGKLQKAILDAVPKNVEALASDLPFVELGTIEEYAHTRVRAARYLASIRSQETQGIDKALLKKLCKETDVEVSESKGKLSVSAGCEMAFLEALDRRRYVVTLVREKPEPYRAPSRKRIGSSHL